MKAFRKELKAPVIPSQDRPNTDMLAEANDQLLDVKPQSIPPDQQDKFKDFEFNVTGSHVLQRVMLPMDPQDENFDEIQEFVVDAKEREAGEREESNSSIKNKIDSRTAALVDHKQKEELPGTQLDIMAGEQHLPETQTHVAHVLPVVSLDASEVH